MSPSSSGLGSPALYGKTSVRVRLGTPVPLTGGIPGLAGCRSTCGTSKEPCSTRHWSRRSAVRTADCRSANRGSIPLGTASPRCGGTAHDATNVDGMGIVSPPGYQAVVVQRKGSRLLSGLTRVRISPTAPRARRPRGEGTGFLNRRSGFESQRAYLSPRRSTERTPRSDRENGSSILPEGIM